MDTLRSRRVQFGLSTLLVVIPRQWLYWPVRIRQANRAREEFQTKRAEYDWDVITAAEVCQASLELYGTETRVPFANRARAADDHLARVERVWNLAYGPTSEWLMGVANDEQRAEAEARMEKVRRYCTDAAEMAGIQP